MSKQLLKESGGTLNEQFGTKTDDLSELLRWVGAGVLQRLRVSQEHESSSPTGVISNLIW
jgi:hypothetical protein